MWNSLSSSEMRCFQHVSHASGACITSSEVLLLSASALQEAYGILNRFEVEVTKEESEGVDTLRYSFNKLQSKAVSTRLILSFHHVMASRKTHAELLKPSLVIRLLMYNLHAEDEPFLSSISTKLYEPPPRPPPVTSF